MGILQALIRVFFTIGFFGFGGGYSIIALIRHLVVVEEKWLTDLQFIDVLAISQVTPGPIAINAATFIGYKMGGIIGSLVATLFSVTAPFFLVYFTSVFIHNIGREKVDLYLALLTPLTFALITSGTYSIVKDSISDIPQLLIFFFAFILGYKYKWNLTRIFLFAGFVGLFFYLTLR